MSKSLGWKVVPKKEPDFQYAPGQIEGIFKKLDPWMNWDEPISVANTERNIGFWEGILYACNWDEDDKKALSEIIYQLKMGYTITIGKY